MPLSSSTHAETDSPPPITNQTAGKVGTETFNNPTEFLSVLKDNFYKISGGANEISLPDLEFEETHGSTAAIREASTIAAEHIHPLGSIFTQNEINGYSTQDLEKMDTTWNQARDGSSVISMKDLNFALDMSQGKTFWHTADNLAADATAFVGSAAAVGGGVAALFVPTPVTVAVSGVLVVGGLGMMGVSAYAMDKDSQRFPEISRQDTAMFNSWLKPGT